VVSPRLHSVNVFRNAYLLASGSGFSVLLSGFLELYLERNYHEILPATRNHHQLLVSVSINACSVLRVCLFVHRDMSCREYLFDDFIITKFISKNKATPSCMELSFYLVPEEFPLIKKFTTVSLCKLQSIDQVVKEQERERIGMFVFHVTSQKRDFIC
jgi:hypothetical protein